jgi:branched-chain amino acid transport system ATP-binding protein
MSGGEQQMCAMARALMARPILLMIDEMSLGLAPVVVEQDVHLALSGADRGYVMETGRIVHEGAAKDLIDDPEVRRAYLGL